ncbi:unnamed protein product [Durusdinium trenchii]|uniref:Uncharacterized protein n=1 Tax=Durusdinium trenchii TaxID=1381693 RepID=A0ABP0QWB1_9DINO
MEILIAPGEPLGQAQKDEIAKAFKFLALKSDGARHRQREGLPMKVSRALVPQLLRGCGRAVSEKQLSELMGSVEEAPNVKRPLNLSRLKAFCWRTSTASTKRLRRNRSPTSSSSSPRCGRWT